MGIIDPAHLATLDVTHVQYHPDDPWGASLAFVSLMPVLVLTAYVAIFLVRRESIYLSAFAGQFITEVINGVLKNRIQQLRPTDFLGRGFGMPSSHAQFCGFFVAFWTLHLLVHQPVPRAPLAQRVDNWIFIALVWLFGALTCYSRCHLMYHTPAQVGVGALLGSAIGFVFYVGTETSLRGADSKSMAGRVRRFLFTNTLARALRVRDSWSAWRDGGVGIEYATWYAHFSASHGGVLRDGSLGAHVRMMLYALAQADFCEAVETAFSVGCVIAVPGMQLVDPAAPATSLQHVEPHVLATGFSRELPGNTHAEECALEKLARYCTRTPEGQSRAAIDYASTREPINLLLYTTMEPCSERLSGNKPCVARILEANAQPMYTTGRWLAKLAASLPENAGAARIDGDELLRPLRISIVFQGVPEPADFVKCVGQRRLRDHGIDVVTVAPEASPAAAGVSLPNLASVPVVIDAADPGAWLRDACLRMARKGHKQG